MKKFLFIGGLLALGGVVWMVFGESKILTGKEKADQIRDDLGQFDATTTGKERDPQYSGTTTGKKITTLEDV